MLSKEALDEFKKIYFEEYGEDAVDDEALELGIGLLTVMNHVYRPLKREWVDELTDREQH